MCLWNLENRHKEAELQGYKPYVNSVAISYDNKYVVSGGEDKMITVLALKNRRQKAIMQGHTDIVTSVSITHNNKYVVSGGGDNRKSELIVWDLQKKDAKKLC